MADAHGREASFCYAYVQRGRLAPLFYEMVHYFNEELHEPFKIYLADEEAILALNLDPEKYLVTEQEDLKDYLYDGNAMRTLSGKKLHKKKNHLCEDLS